MCAFRTSILALLVLQNSIYTLLRRYYCMGSTKQQVSFPAVLLATEVMKFVVSALLVELPDEMRLPNHQQPHAGSRWLVDRVAAVKRALRFSFPLAVPAITYAIMNMISYKALEHIDATVFAMIAQLKTVSTAMFSWPVLGRSQSLPQWRAILVLTFSVSIITYQKGAAGKGVDVHFSSSFAVGVLLTLIEITLSGWINTYFEKQLKDGQFSVWGRNLQLGFWSTFIYIVVLTSPMSKISVGAQPALPATFAELEAQLVGVARGLLSPVALLLIALGGGGGLLVAFAIKHADAILKSMATAFALVLVVGGEAAFLGATVDPVVALASCLAVLGLQAYQDAPKAHIPTQQPCPDKEAKSPQPLNKVKQEEDDARILEEEPLLELYVATPAVIGRS